MRRSRSVELTRKLLEYHCNFSSFACPRYHKENSSITLTENDHCYYTCTVSIICKEYDKWHLDPDKVMIALANPNYCRLRARIARDFNISAMYIRRWCKAMQWTGVDSDKPRDT